jgi:uncharacterized protein
VTEAQIQQDLKQAMLARDQRKVYVLRGLLAAIKNLKVEKLVQELTDADLTALARKELSKRAEAVAFAEKAARADLVEQNRAEQAILQAYLPAQMASEELEQTIRALSTELGTTQIGPLMKELRERHAGRFDGKLASELIRKLLTLS